jgi:hypothetical protein
MMPMRWLLLPIVLLLAMAPAGAQLPRAPSGGPTGNFLGPPSGNQADFLGAWNLRWVGPMGSSCPCSGSLTITTNAYGELQGEWKMNGPTATLQGSTGYDQNVWSGRFAQPDDVDFPIKGHFRLESRGSQALSGSYQPDGTALPFTWSATR